MRMQPRISFSVDSLLGRKTTRGDGDNAVGDRGEVSKMTILTELDRNDNQLPAASIPPLLLAAVRGQNLNGGEDDHRRRRHSWREEEEEAETRFPLSEVFRQSEAMERKLAENTSPLNDSADCIKEEEESDTELCVDGDEEDEDGGGMYEDEDDDPDDCSPRGRPSASGRLHPVMPTPLLGRPHPLSGLPAGLLRPPWGHPPAGHLSLPFGSSLFDKGTYIFNILVESQSFTVLMESNFVIDKS